MKRIRTLLILLLLLLVPAKEVRAEEKVEVPEEVIELSEELGEKYCICPELLQAMAWRESRFNPEAVNGSCIGMMQVSERWHRDRMERLGVTDLTDMRQNMLVATDYLAELADKYGDIDIVLMVYNGDSRAGTGIVSEYAETIMMLSAELERMHGK